MSREDLGVEGGDACDVRRLIECAVVTALALVKEDDDAGARVEIEGEEGKAGGCAGPAWKVVHSQVRVCACTAFALIVTWSRHLSRHPHAISFLRAFLA
jgi:hypothetical protein